MKDTKKTLGFSTRAIHGGQSPDPTTGAVMPPIYATSTYAQSSPGVHQGYEYSRTQNPTRMAYERCIADLEGGSRGFAFASGMAATATLLELVDSGDHVVAMDDLYGGSFRLFERVRRRSANLDFTFADLSDPKAAAAAIGPKTRMIWIETPTNPLLKLVDIAAVVAAARGRGILVVVDNTFATPWIQRPLELGADIVMHSATKFLNGHSDMVGGVAIVGDAALGERIGFLQNAIGAVGGPFDSFLALRGLKTLPLRMRRSSESALEIAAWLERHPRVERVIYPGLPSHPQHALAKRQMAAGRQRDRHLLPQGRAARSAAFPRAARGVHAGREPGRRREPGGPPGDHDPRLGAAGGAREARHQRLAGAALGRDRGCARPRR